MAGVRMNERSAGGAGEDSPLQLPARLPCRGGCRATPEPQEAAAHSHLTRVSARLLLCFPCSRSSRSGRPDTSGLPRDRHAAFPRRRGMWFSERGPPPCTSFSYSALNSCRPRGDYVDGAQAGRRTSKGEGGPVLWHRLSPGTTLKKKKKKISAF